MKNLACLTICIITVLKLLGAENIDIFQGEYIEPNEKFIEIMKKNRTILKRVSHWLDEDSYKNAVYFYGLPTDYTHMLDIDIGFEPTYSDLLVYLSQYIKNPIRYLELGVSFGKNLYQMICSLKHSTFVAIDIEKINPILENLLQNRCEIDEWENTRPIEVDEKIDYFVKKYSPIELNKPFLNLVFTGTAQPKNFNNSLKKYDHLETLNEVFYYNFDLFDESSWKRISHNQINLLFSDACHTPEGILYEVEMLVKYQLLDKNNFVMVWDDLGGVMTDAFMKAYQILKSEYGDKVFFKLIKCRGWLGVKIHHHNVGIVALID